MKPALYTRRHALRLTAGTLAAGASRVRSQSPSLAHINVATLEHDRVLAEASTALAAPIAPITATVPPGGKPHEFRSESEPVPGSSGSVTPPFRAHARALREMSATVACLAAAYLLTGEAAYAQRAAEHVRANLLTPATLLAPEFDGAGSNGSLKATPDGIVDLVPLAELSRALVFLGDSEAFTANEQDALQAWFKSAYDWLNTNRASGIARDKPDHRGSAWLLLAAAFARFTRDENALEANRKLFRAPTLRHQIRTDGVFPQEVATANPFRNALFNFDLLTGACQLLSSPFDPLWSYELLDGVGLRIVAAYLYPLMAHPERWPFVADADHFRDLPGRRPGLLFTGRAYNRPEYVELWQKLPTGPPPEALAETFPIREPLLWTARAPHGL